MNLAGVERLARRLHRGEIDEAGTGYVDHLARVVAMVAADGGDRWQQMAAWLRLAVHDDDFLRATAIRGLAGLAGHEQLIAGALSDPSPQLLLGSDHSAGLAAWNRLWRRSPAGSTPGGPGPGGTRCGCWSAPGRRRLGPRS